MLGCESIQIFTKNQRRWAAPELTNEEALAFRKMIRLASMTVVVHDSYLINLASPDEELRTKSMNAFHDEIDRADRLHAQGLIFHPGSPKGRGKKEGIKSIIDCLNSICSESDRHMSLLIEITAGQGSQIGSTFDEIAAIINGVKNSERIGVCFDTAHAFAAGYDFRKKSQYRQVMNRFNDTIGISRIKAFHLNDTSAELGSHRDRHANIGCGAIGDKPFRFFVTDDRFSNIPMILETPGGFEQYRVDLNLLRQYNRRGGFVWNFMRLKK